MFYITKKKCEWRWLTNLETFQPMHMAQRIFMHDVFIFRKGPPSWQGHQTWWLGSLPLPRHRLTPQISQKDMSQIFPESTLRTPTHGFSITNAVLQMLYCGKHLRHVATCFDKKPQLVTLHMSHMSSSKYCIFHPPTRAPHRPRGWRHDRRIASSAYPMQVSWPKEACSMVLVRLIQAKLWGKRWNSSWLHATLATFQCQEKAVQSSNCCWICLEQKNWEVFPHSKSKIIPRKNACLAMAAPRGVELDKHLGGSKGCKGATAA